MRHLRPVSTPDAVLAALLALLAAPALAQRTPSAPPIDAEAFAALRFRHVGPEGNRVTAVAGVAGDPDTYYVGAASGGVWRTADGGVRWEPVFDGQGVSSIGALAVAPSDARVVWAGTGESSLRSHVSIGMGVFRSDDGGRTWRRAGLEATGRIARIAVHPQNPDVVLVAALGHAFGSQEERGVYRTTDGGRTWARVLFPGDSAGASDVVFHPTSPSIVYAGSWQVVMRPWERVSGGGGSGVWKSTDGGATWRRLSGRGLPFGPVGKVGLAVSPAAPERVYALIETGDGAPFRGQATDTGRLWRSDDGGETWTRISHDRQLMGRGAYFGRMAAAPDDADEAYFLSSELSRTRDGGRTVEDLGMAPGIDFHDLWIDPADPERMIAGGDLGVAITTSRGDSWRRISLPIAQMYHVTTDDRIPYNLYGNRQDGPSFMGPSNSRVASLTGGEAGIRPWQWQPVGGGESGWATPDRADTTLVWSSSSSWGSLGGVVTRYDLRTRLAHAVEVWPRATQGWPADSLRYRFGWTFPLVVSAHAAGRVYVGSQHVHATDDGGRTWREMSPDLTRDEEARQGSSGGLTPDNLGVEYWGALAALAESPRSGAVLWAGSNDGRVHVTRDGGATWTDVTANVPGLPDGGSAAFIEASPFAEGTAYLVVDAHLAGDFAPYVYRTDDFGRTWRAIVDGLPRTPLGYAHVLREDPARRGLLYLGTEGGLFVSLDGGGRWMPLQNNLPPAPVYGMVVQPRFGDLVVATYGRGFWILDDLTPLRQATPDVVSRPIRLFTPRPAYRFRSIGGPPLPPPDVVTGENPPYGASIDFWSADGGDTVTVRIEDERGATVRTLRVPSRAGVNRVWWELRGEPTRPPRLRIPPPGAPWMRSDTAARRSPGVWPYALLSPPGRYTVVVRSGDEEQRVPLVVFKDPSSGGTEETIAEQHDLLRAIVADLDSASALITAAEDARARLRAVRDPSSSASSDLRAEADSLDARLLAVEERLFQPRVTGRGQDLIRWPMRLAEQLWHLASGLESSDHAPTAAQRQVHELLRGELRAASAALEPLLRHDLVRPNGRIPDPSGR
jgi:photosystem II stability/assembly factor-like uncharacterized protein